MISNKFAYPLLACIVIAIAGGSWWFITNARGPKEEAGDFARTLQGGDLGKTLTYFGKVVCRCPIKHTWASNLLYQSGQQPNLAFLMGHPFIIGEPILLATNCANLQWPPWKRSEGAVLNLPLQFDKRRYRPIFLPFLLAYGQNITWKDWQKFIDNPADGAWQGFTLRLRPGLTPGSIKPKVNIDALDAITKADLARANAKLANVKSNSRYSQAQQLVMAAVQSPIAINFQPQEAGHVQDKSGAIMPLDKVEKQLPRLQSATLNLSFFRNRPWHRWKITHFSIIKPILSLNDGKIIDVTQANAQTRHDQH